MNDPQNGSEASRAVTAITGPEGTDWEDAGRLAVTSLFPEGEPPYWFQS